MSGGHFDYSYQKLDYENMSEVNGYIEKGLETIKELCRRCEWIESGDSSWDTEEASKWYQLVNKLCAELCNVPTKSIKPSIPTAPVHFPYGKPYCQYCGSEEPHWNPQLQLNRDI